MNRQADAGLHQFMLYHLHFLIFEYILVELQFQVKSSQVDPNYNSKNKLMSSKVPPRPLHAAVRMQGAAGAGDYKPVGGTAESRRSSAHCSTLGRRDR